MTLVLIGKGLVSEGPTPKTKDKWVPGIYIYSIHNKFELVTAQVICNNLGGFGPDTNVPEQLHYRGTARLHHRAVDVVH